MSRHTKKYSSSRYSFSSRSRSATQPLVGAMRNTRSRASPGGAVTLFDKASDKAEDTIFLSYFFLRSFFPEARSLRSGRAFELSRLDELAPGPHRLILRHQIFHQQQQS